MRNVFLVAAFVAQLFMFQSVALADTWLFGAAACPPWKAVQGDPKATSNMAGACAKDMALFVDGFKSAFGVADDHIVTLVDQEATVKNVTEAIANIAKKAQPEDRVILYVNTHGGKVEALYKGYSTEDEIFAWYTSQEPKDFKKATADGQWMTARAFRDQVNKIMAHEIVTIIEACHASVSQQDFINNVHDGMGGRGLNWPGREAVIFSSHAEQIANFTADGKEALFTRTWHDVLQSTKSATLFESFEAARLKTHRKQRANCAKGKTHKELLKDWASYRDLCTQMPTSWDPFGLLDDIAMPQSDLATGN